MSRPIVMAFSSLYSYCINCLTTYMTQSSAGNSFTCPVCRKGFERSGIRLANDLEKGMANEVVVCADCHMRVSCY